MRVERIGDCTLYLGDCLEVLPTLGTVDAVVTDPPYPSYLTEEYQYNPTTVHILATLDCRQFVFWTPAAPFPLSYSGKRIWDKAVGTNTQFEEIYERNNGSGYKVHRHYVINSTVAASYTGDDYTPHPSQKPIELIRQLVKELDAHTILDPFMGSGTTGVACHRLGRKFIGIEISEEYFEIACERIDKEVSQGRLFQPTIKPEQLKL